MAILRIASPLRKFVGKQTKVIVESSELFDALKEIDGKYPHFLSKVCDTNGRIYSYLDVFINDKSVDKINGGKSKIGEKDEICIIPAVNDKL